MEQTFPEIEQAVRLFTRYSFFRHGDKALPGNLCATDPDIFDVFDFEILRGDPQTVFSEPFAVFVTESMARRFFGDEDPIGKILVGSERYLPGEYVVRGILRDLPRNSHIRFDVLSTTIPKNQYTDDLWHEWRLQSGWRTVHTYVKLREGTDPEELERKFPMLVETYLGSELTENISYRLTQIDRVWLYAHQDFGIDWYGDISLLHTIGTIAAFILLIACINYINLATARSQSRAVEVGLRKVVGQTVGRSPANSWANPSYSRCWRPLSESPWRTCSCRLSTA